MVMKMKKVFNYISTLIYFYLLILFAIISHSFANEDYVFYSIVIIVISIFVTCLSFMLNKSKKIEVRRFYLMDMVMITLYAITMSIYCLAYKVLGNSLFYKWLQNFIYAGLITFYIFQFFYTIKPFLKKGYEIQKFDYQNFTMLINSLAFGLVITFLFLKVTVHYPNSMYNDFSTYSLEFNEIKWPIVFITIGYTLFYAIINICFYRNIESKSK